jgi:carbamoyltransferase
MLVLGINCVYHESSAALVHDGRLLFAAEEERFNRRKHGKPADPDKAHWLPREAVTQCLTHARRDIEEVDAIAVSFDPPLRERQFHEDLFSVSGKLGQRVRRGRVS